MRFTWLTMVKDLRRRLRDPFSILMWAGIPFVILLLFSMAFGSGGDIKPQAIVLVADLDQSLLSGFLTGAFNQGELADLVNLEAVELEDGHKRIARGKATAFLIIPEGFGQAVLNDEPVALRLLTNPAQRILPGIVQGVLDTLVDGTFYAQQVLGEPVRKIMDSTDGLNESPSNALIALVSIEINETIQRLEGFIFPPAIELVVEKEVVEDADDGIGFGGMFFQSMLFMFLLFATSGVSDELWRERQEGTLRRILTTPGNLTAFLLGKVLAGVGFIGAILALALLAATWLYDLPWATFPVALLWLVLVAGLMIAMFGMIQLFAASRQGAGLLLNLIIFPMMMLGGSFFPPESMPDWLVEIGAWTPNGYGLQVLKSLQAGSPDVTQVAVSFAILGILTIAMLWFNSVLLRRRFAGDAS